MLTDSMLYISNSHCIRKGEFNHSQTVLCLMVRFDAIIMVVLPLEIVKIDTE